MISDNIPAELGRKQGEGGRQADNKICLHKTRSQKTFLGRTYEADHAIYMKPDLRTHSGHKEV